MAAQASRTTAWAMPARSPFGSQRLQARKPAASASGGLRKKRTFLRSGRGDGQPGRQYTPMVVTAYRKSPGWRVRTCCQRCSSGSRSMGWVSFMRRNVAWARARCHPGVALTVADRGARSARVVAARGYRHVPLVAPVVTCLQSRRWPHAMGAARTVGARSCPIGGANPSRDRSPSLTRRRRPLAGDRHRRAWSSRRPRRYAARIHARHGGTDAVVAGNSIARDEHLLARAHQSRALLSQRHHPALRPGRDRLLPRHRHLHGRLPRRGG